MQTSLTGGAGSLTVSCVMYDHLLYAPLQEFVLTNQPTWCILLCWKASEEENAIV